MGVVVSLVDCASVELVVFVVVAAHRHVHGRSPHDFLQGICPLKKWTSFVAAVTFVVVVVAAPAAETSNAPGASIFHLLLLLLMMMSHFVVDLNGQAGHGEPETGHATAVQMMALEADRQQH